ncbi:MAG: HPr family phosphocarrier protein [Stomatobaculum sp.]|nr:HPr family phosphocarrier protein [Stomatobaculum sp.]
MFERTVRLRDRDSVSEFVKAAAECSFNVDVCYNRIVVDGKSILGVLGLDLTRDLTVRYEGFDPEFEKTLLKFAAK